MVVTDGNSPVMVTLIAGGAAGATEAAITYPFEFVKTRVQLREQSASTTSRNPFRVVYNVYATEGLAAMYQGCIPFVIGTVGKDIVRFVSFDMIKAQFKNPETGHMSPLGTLGAAASSGILASTLAVTPSERIKTALIDDARGERRFKSATHGIRTIIAEQGLLGLYRGYAGTTMKQAGATAFRIGTYNILKDYEKKHNIAQTTVVNFANGSIAGTITAVATQPFDTIKTRSQSARGCTTGEAFRSILADYGFFRGLWKGTAMRMSRTVVSGGILFTSYEFVAKLVTPFFAPKESKLKLSA